MSKVFKYLTTYIVWIVDLVLALWVVYLGRTTLQGLFVRFYTGDVRVSHAYNFIDKAFLILLGLGWLIFMIVIEGYFRTKIDDNRQPRRLASVTGWVLLVIFMVDLILAWAQGISAGSWMRWLALAAELGFGIALLVLAKTRFTPKST
jgi:hypothetical protein